MAKYLALKPIVGMNLTAEPGTELDGSIFYDGTKHGQANGVPNDKYSRARHLVEQGYLQPLDQEAVDHVGVKFAPDPSVVSAHEQAAELQRQLDEARAENEAMKQGGAQDETTKALEAKLKALEDENAELRKTQSPDDKKGK